MNKTYDATELINFIRDNIKPDANDIGLFLSDLNAELVFFFTSRAEHEEALKFDQIFFDKLKQACLIKMKQLRESAYQS